MKNKFKIINIIILFLFAICLVGCNKETPNTLDKYIVTFDSNGGSEVEKIEVKPGDLIKKPKDPEKEGYTFIEWQLKGRRFNFSTAIKSDITLKAKWELTGTGSQEVAEYSVFFDTNGGTKIETVKVKSGTKVNKPKNPTKTGYTFKEWQFNGKTYNFENAVNSDIELVAVWTENEKPKPSPSPSPSVKPSPSPSTKPSVKPSPSPSTKPSPSPSVRPTPLPSPPVIAQGYNVSFNTNGGSVIETIVVKEGLPVTRPANPTKEGYNFKEWQLNGSTYDFNTKITADITLNAIWIQKNCTVKVTPVNETSTDKKLTVYLDGTEISVREIKLTNGTLLCSGSNPVVSESSLAGVTELKVVLNSGSILNASIQ